MMRIIKKSGLFAVVFITLIFVLTTTVLAEGDADYSKLYSELLGKSNAEEITHALPRDTFNILKDLGLDLKNPDEGFMPKGENFFALLWDFLKDGGAAPLKTCLAIIGILLIFASFDGFLNGEWNNTTIFVCFISSIVATAPIYSVMNSVRSAIQSISTFMLSLVPVYSGIMLSAGQKAAFGGFSTLLLGASEVVSYLISYLFVPVSGAITCLAICGGISPVAGVLRIGEWIKKCSNYAMGIATTLFLGILSLQNTFAVAADGIGIRASKAMLSSTIPIMGPAIAETIATAKGCLNLLRSGVGIYAVVAVGILALPVITELILWRFSMWISSAVAETFGLKQVETLLKSIDFGLSVLLAATCFTAILFIIALAMTLNS